MQHSIHQRQKTPLLLVCRQHGRQLTGFPGTRTALIATAHLAGDHAPANLSFAQVVRAVQEVVVQKQQPLTGMPLHMPDQLHELRVVLIEFFRKRPARRVELQPVRQPTTQLLDLSAIGTGTLFFPGRFPLRRIIQQLPQISQLVLLPEQRGPFAKNRRNPAIRLSR